MIEEAEKRERLEEAESEERPSKQTKISIDKEKNGEGTDEKPTNLAETPDGVPDILPPNAEAAEINSPMNQTESLAVPDADTVQEPATDSVVESATDPVVESVTEPVAESTTEPVVESVTGPVAESVTEPVAESTTEPVAESTTEPVAESTTESVAESVTGPVAESTTEPVAESTTEPVVESVTEPVAESVTATVSQALTEPAKVENPTEQPVPKKMAPIISPTIYSVIPSGLPPLDITVQPTITNSEAMVEERGQIPALYVGRVIGKGGEMIRDLQARSGCRIDVDQNVPAGQPRIITYRGTRWTVDDAKKMVSLLCQQDGNETLLPIGEAKRKQLIVPSSSIGKIIGRGGEMIRELQNRSQAKIQVDHSSNSQTGYTRAMTIIGTHQSVAKAEEMVLFLVANPMMDAIVSINMLVEDKVKSGGRWGSGPPYLNLPNHGQNMMPQGQQQPHATSFGYSQGASVGGGSGYPGYPPQQMAPQQGGGSQYGMPSMQQSHYGSGNVSSEVEVFLTAKMYMGRIIGQKGMTINDVQKRSGCDIQVNQNVPSGQDCEITIKGSRQGIENVKQMLREIIEMGPNHPYAGGQGQINVGSGGGIGSYPPISHSGFGGTQPTHTYGTYQQQPPMQQPLYGQQSYGSQQAPYLAQQTYTQPLSMGGVQPYQQQPIQQYGQAPIFAQQSPQAYQHVPQQQYAPQSMIMPTSVVWKTAKTGDGQVYYYNEKTGETQWEKPAGMP